MGDDEAKVIAPLDFEDIDCCSEWWDHSKDPDERPWQECPECGRTVGASGSALIGCEWSPVECETCGAAPCDGSC